MKNTIVETDADTLVLILPPWFAAIMWSTFQQNKPFGFYQTIWNYILSYGGFLIKRIYCKFLPNSDINGPVNRQFSQASRRKPFGPLFYSQTFRSLTVVPLNYNLWAIILLADFQIIDCCAFQLQPFGPLFTCKLSHHWLLCLLTITFWAIILLANFQIIDRCSTGQKPFWP